MKLLNISSGHGEKVSGAIGLVSEVKMARELTNLIAYEFTRLYKGKATAMVFHDNLSKNQKENLNAINQFHKKKKADLDVSIHLNSSGATVEKGIGVEVLYKQSIMLGVAERVSLSISKATRLKNRGAKKRTDLSFLNNGGDILIEAYFVNSKEDVKLMDEEHEKISFANAVAIAIGNAMDLKLNNDEYRFKSGMFSSYDAVVKAVFKATELGIVNKKWIQYNINDGKYFFTSGVYKSKEDAEKVIDLLKKNKILSKAHLIKV